MAEEKTDGMKRRALDCTNISTSTPTKRDEQNERSVV
jgi:hypothetical protein